MDPYCSLEVEPNGPNGVTLHAASVHPEDGDEVEVVIPLAGADLVDFIERLYRNSGLPRHTAQV